jgi:3-dehydroquinate synthetase
MLLRPSPAETHNNGNFVPCLCTLALQDVMKGLAEFRTGERGSFGSIVVITDSNVWRWHGARLLASFTAAGAPPLLIHVLPPGEAAKTRATKEMIEDWMLTNRFVQRVPR